MRIAETTEATVAHTPLPWHIVYRDDCDNPPELRDADGNYVPLSGRTNELAHRNAAFIVRACNSHDELLQAVKILQKKLSMFNRQISPFEVAKDKELDFVRTSISKAEGR
jgi:hypothetical protein